jgi:hypothetical protein
MSRVAEFPFHVALNFLWKEFGRWCKRSAFITDPKVFRNLREEVDLNYLVCHALVY